MHSITIYLRNYIIIPILSRISSNITARKLTLGRNKSQLNINFKMVFELLAYNGVLGIPYKIDPIVRPQESD
jgi:hypothetical protein